MLMLKIVPEFFVWLNQMVHLDLFVTGVLKILMKFLLERLDYRIHLDFVGC